MSQPDATDAPAEGWAGPTPDFPPSPARTAEHFGFTLRPDTGMTVTLTDAAGDAMTASLPPELFLATVEQTFGVVMLPMAQMPAVSPDGLGWLTTDDGRVLVRTATTTSEATRATLDAAAVLVWVARRDAARA